MLAMASSGIAVLPSFKMGVTSTGSQVIGAWFHKLLMCVDELQWNWKRTTNLGSSEDVLDSLRDFRSNTVTLNQTNGVVALRNC